MELGQSIPIIDQVFYITSHRNTGAAWGILAGSDVVFLHHNNGVDYWYCLLHTALCKRTKASRRRSRFMLGGAIGNFIDRVFRQEVVDFIHVTIVNYQLSDI
jgi:signal peptidase II